MSGKPFQTLGLDVGTNSLGWAVVSHDSEGLADSLVDCGVRIFQEAVDAKTREPKNHTRRRARLARRILSRRRRRKTRLRNRLIKLGWLPIELANHPQPEIVLNELDADDAGNPGTPYLLRKKGLDEPLSLHQLGRVLMHLCARRGFQSNRKALLIGELAKEYEDFADAADSDTILEESLTRDDAEDLGRIKAEIAGLWAEILARGCRTLGEFLAELPPSERKRARHTDRKMYKLEFEQLWQSQARFHEEFRDDSLKAEIFDLIFFQRPLKSAKSLVAACSLEPLRKRAMRGRLDVQEFLLRLDLNHLQILDPDTRHFVPLAPEHRESLFQRLQQQRSLSWSEAKKLIGAPYPKSQKFNLEESKSKLTGNRVACDLRAILPEHWDVMERQRQDALVEDLLTISSKNDLINRLRNHWAFSREQSYRLATLELPLGYANHSVKAINKLLPWLRKGLIYSAAREAAGYGFDRRPAHTMGLLPEPPVVRNPVVQKALYEVRKVANALIKTYGKPDVIRVEMARDLVVPKRVRDAQDKQNKSNQRLNEKAREALAAPTINIQNPRHDDLLKYRLAEECGWICPYTGRTISLHSLFADGVWDIEHILPYGRTLDDSYMNKTLCYAEFNRLIKKGQTPREVKERMEGGWEGLLQRIKGLPNAKKRRFLQEDLGPIDDFIARQLNDTRYIAVAVKDYLAKLGADIQFTRGGMTADLRHHWGLNSLLSDSGEKERRDHRHHVVDAVVVATTTRSLYMGIHRLAREREIGPNRAPAKPSKLPIACPWPAFRDDIAANLDRLIVSHAPNHKVTGALHDSLPLGLIRLGEKNVLVQRKPVDPTLSVQRAGKIIDTEVRNRVLARLKEHNNNPKGAFADLTKAPLFLNEAKGVQIKKVRLRADVTTESTTSFKDRRDIPYKYLKLNSYHHATAFRNKVTGRYKTVFVSMLDAARAVRIAKAPLFDRTPPANWPDQQQFEFAFTFVINDLFEVESNEGTDYFRVQGLESTNDRITLRHHRSALSTDASAEITKTINSLLKDFKIRKVQVDPIGRLATAND